MSSSAKRPNANRILCDIKNFRNKVIDEEAQERENLVVEFKALVEKHLDGIDWRDVVAKGTKSALIFGVRNNDDLKRIRRDTLYDLGCVGPVLDERFRLYSTVKNEVEDEIVVSQKYPVVSIAIEDVVGPYGRDENEKEVYGNYFILKCGI